MDGREDQEDLSDVIREEQRRGRRPISTEARRKRQALLRDFAAQKI